MVVITLRVKMTRSNTFTMRWNLIKHSESFLISVVIWVWSKFVISNDWLRSITNLLNKGSIVKCKIFIWVSKNVRNQHRLRIQVFAMNEIPSGVIHPHQSQRKCSLRLSLALCSVLFLTHASHYELQDLVSDPAKLYQTDQDMQSVYDPFLSIFRSFFFTYTLGM